MREMEVTTKGYTVAQQWAFCDARWGRNSDYTQLCAGSLVVLTFPLAWPVPSPLEENETQKKKQA